MIKELFLANNNMDALDIFNYRKLYHENAMEGANVKKIDLWYDAIEYGKVDFKNNSIYISESNLKQLNSQKGTFLALDFVVDAFDDFQKYIEKAVGAKKIKTSGVIAKLEPQKAWTSATNLHHIHIDSLYKLFVLSYLKTDSGESEIKTFEDFLIEFLNFVEQIKYTFPITRSSFIKSRYCPINVSGLVIEIEDKKRDDDLIKQMDILEDVNFIFYKEAAKRFSFFIDKNLPSRLIFDIMSNRAVKYMKEYGVKNTEFFKLYSYKALDYDMEILKNYLTNMWNSYVASYPNAKEMRAKCDGRKSLSVNVKRQPVDLKFYNDEFWLDYYFRVRIKEERKEWDDYEINSKIKNAIDVQKKLDILSSLSYIENTLRK